MASSPRRAFALILTALLLLAVNLRLAVTSASALLTPLIDAGVLSQGAAVLVPALPTAMFALAGLATPRITRWIGARAAVSGGTVALAAGMLVRMIPDSVAIVGGTIVATAGLAVVNILLPALVRATCGGRVGAVTTAYTTVMSLGAAAAAVPVAQALGSPSLGLGAWALPAILAAVVWTVVARGAGIDASISTPEKTRRPLPAGSLALTAFFALQALSSYVIMGWLPTIAVDAGIPSARAGVLLGIAMALGIPATAIVVALSRTAGRLRIGVSLVAVSSIAGFWLAPTHAPELWAALLGIGMCAFPMVLALIARVGHGPADSARVSAVAQGVGYAVATVGPLGAGAFHGGGGSWAVVLGVLIAGAAVQAVIGFSLTRLIAEVTPAEGTVPVGVDKESAAEEEPAVLATPLPEPAQVVVEEEPVQRP